MQQDRLRQKTAHPADLSAVRFIISSLAIFLVSLLYFIILQPWKTFRDPDSFYHAKLTDIILHGTTTVGAQGIHVGPFFFLRNFPWLDLTLLGDHFVDQHLLYHLALTPFVAAFGMFDGLQLATVFFAAIFITIFYITLRFLKIQHPSLWTFLILISMPLSFRLSLGKATPLALTFFIVGLAALLSIFRICRESLFAAEDLSEILKKAAETKQTNRDPQAAKRDSRQILQIVFSFITGLGFSLSHGGWIILPISQGILIFVSAMVLMWSNRSVFKTINVLRSTYYVLGSTILGIILGLLIHPNRANLFMFLKVQVFQVALATPTSIQLGLEWSSITPLQLISNIAPLLMASAVVVLGLLFARRRDAIIRWFEMDIALAVLTLALTLFTLKSSRMIEYLVPVFALWLGLLWSQVDTHRLKNEISQLISEQVQQLHLPKLTLWSPCFIAALLIGAFVAVLIRDARGTFFELRFGRPFDRLAPITTYLSQVAQPGDRLFYDRWDSFGELFALAPQFHYITGVDPTFLLAANPALAEAYEESTKNLTVSLPPIFQTRFSLIERSQTCRQKNQQIQVKTITSILCE